MNLRCFYCQTPFTLGRAEILAALQQMDSENMNHYDAHCPRCRRANSVSRQRLEMFMPNWREAVAEEAAMSPLPETMPAPPEEQAPAPEPAPVMPPAQPMSASEAMPKVRHPRKRAGSAKKAVTRPATKAASKAKKPAATKAKSAAKPKAKTTAVSKSKKATTKSKKK